MKSKACYKHIEELKDINEKIKNDPKIKVFIERNKYQNVQESLKKHYNNMKSAVSKYDEYSTDTSDADVEIIENENNDNLKGYTVVDNSEEKPEYVLNQEFECKNEEEFNFIMLHYEEAVGKKMYCIRTDKNDKFKKEYSFCKRGKTDIKTYENYEENKFKFCVVTDIYAMKFEKEDNSKDMKSSIFYRRQSKKLNGKCCNFSVNRLIHEKMQSKLNEVKDFHNQSSDALRKQFSRMSDTEYKEKYTKDEYSNLIEFCGNYKNTHKDENDFVLTIGEGKDLIWAFALKQMGEVAKMTNEWHIDATYKVLKSGRGLWIISTKENESEKVFPLLFFVIPNEKSEIIQIVLEEYKKWVGNAPESFIADCQKSIKKSVGTVFDQSKFFLCIFHILRATKKQIHIFYSNEENRKICFDMFYEIAMKIFNNEDFDSKVDEFKKFLNETNCNAYRYFYDNYLKNGKPLEWAKSYRDDYSMTNNISEALNNKIKSNYSMNQKTRLDKLAIKIMTTIAPDFVYETFRGKNSISERVKVSKSTEKVIQKNDLEIKFNDLFYKIKEKFRTLDENEKKYNINHLQELLNSIN